ncbi:DUF2487 family protein [Oceanobacillus bengalensis]|uniref:DUF2487 family protein n=1 Tax=Oceanobacillus bengalensis TaxID=1435466 RepID=A0A494YW61_9BACI|nr:DUF2487 family protein [Oceanobacillus bengalensis]RKQ13944.1 DUF2487 family protein [Oceanobacillus bengalensis]
MRWQKSDVDKYVSAKEYIDTLIIPLIDFQMDQDLENNAFQNEVLTILSNELEKELTGRIMLAPSYYYIKTFDKDQEIVRLNHWVENVKKQPFKHIFLLSFDPAWKKSEQALDASFVWIPKIQSGDIGSKEMQHTIREQVKQIGELIRSYW